MIDLIYSNLSFMNHAYSKHTKVNIASAHAICLKFTLRHLRHLERNMKESKPRFQQREFHWLIKRSLRGDPVWDVVSQILFIISQRSDFTSLIILIRFCHRHPYLFREKFVFTQIFTYSINLKIFQPNPKSEDTTYFQFVSIVLIFFHFNNLYLSGYI